MNSIDILLSAVRTQVCGAEAVSFGEISEEQMAELYSISKAQDMAHVVATELDRQGLLASDDEICGKFRKQQFIALMRYERINYELEEICKLLESKEIPHIPLKGSVIRKYYEQPWMRTSADIDLLVHPEDIDRAIDALKGELDYREEGGTEHDRSLFAPSGVHLELHYETIEEEYDAKANLVLKDIWEHSTPEAGWSYRRVNSDGMFYFFHIAHAVKHFANSGCGMRPFLDIWLLCHRAQFDREKREALLRDGELLVFANAAERLADVWFSGAEHDELTRQMERHVFGGGIYGSATNKIITTQIRKGGKLGYAMSRIFLPYKTMMKYYPSLEKRKILLPFYHVYRWCRIIFCGGVKRSVNELKTSSQLADAQKNSVENMLDQLGLK